MNSELFVQDANGNNMAVSGTGVPGAVDVNVSSGVVGIDPAANGTHDIGGTFGVTVTTGTEVVSGAFTSITVLADATFAAFSETGANGDVMTGFVISAGTTIFGNITSYTLTSGKVRAYK